MIAIIETVLDHQRSLEMSLAGQRLQPERYTVVPRTLVLLLRGDSLLLLRVPAKRGAWGGRLNGYGGHIERGEDPLSSALRETQEETGLVPTHLRLCGTILVDTQQVPGIGLFVFVGEVVEGEPQPGSEGTPVWVPLADLPVQELVEDLPALIPRALEAYQGSPPFCGCYRYTTTGELQISFG